MPLVPKFLGRATRCMKNPAAYARRGAGEIEPALSETNITIGKSQTMDYWISIHHDSRRAIVHYSDCVYLQHLKRACADRDMEWHGPYETLGEAIDSGLNMTVRLVRNCHLCR